MFACLHAPATDLAKIAEAFTPWFEQTAPGTIVFEIDGLKQLYGSPQQIADAIARRAGAGVQIAIAETAESAILAARNFSGVHVRPHLDKLDITSLPLPEEFAEILESWGIYTLEQLAELPETGIAERFGEQGVYLQRIAKGSIDRPLKVFEPPTIYSDRIELDHPVELLEPLLFLIARILQEQCRKLESHGMATNRVGITLELDDKTEYRRTLDLPMALRESKTLLKLLQMDLEAHPPQAAIVALSVNLQPVPPRTVQHGIFLPATPAPDRLELTLARIRGIVGENNAGVPELLDTHHPHPFRLVVKQPEIAARPAPVTSRQAFRYFRPPIAASVDLHNGRPARIRASGIQGKILNASGPWRTSGNWWTASPWNRDEWDVMVSETLYRIYREHDDGWFVEGSYD